MSNPSKQPIKRHIPLDKHYVERVSVQHHLKRLIAQLEKAK